MNHKPDVGFIDPHAKGVGGHDDFGLARHEDFLQMPAFVRLKTTMISDDCSLAFVEQHVADFFAGRSS